MSAARTRRRHGGAQPDGQRQGGLERRHRLPELGPLPPHLLEVCRERLVHAAPPAVRPWSRTSAGTRPAGHRSLRGARARPYREPDRRAQERGWPAGDDPRRRRRPAGRPAPSCATCAAATASDYRVVRATSGDEALGAARRARPALPAGRARRLRPADAGHDRHRDDGEGPRDLPGHPAAAAHRLRRHRRRDPGDQRHRARLLHVQAVGAARDASSTRSSTTCSRPGGSDHPDDSSVVRVVGHLWSDRSYDVKMFLARNHIPYAWLDVERDEEAAPAARPRRRRPHRPAARPPARG